MSRSRLEQLVLSGESCQLQRYIQSNPGCLNYTNHYERTPLHIAAAYGRDEMVKVLVLSNRQLLNMKDTTGRSPLYHATDNCRTSTVRLLIRYGCDVSQDERDPDSPMLVACKRGSDEIIKLLYNAKPTLVTSTTLYRGVTPMHYAAQSDRSSTVKLLLQLGCPYINAFTHFQCTPLYLASSIGNEETVTMLLNAGAKERDDGQYRSSIDVAAAHGYCGIMRLLVDRGITDIKTASVHLMMSAIESLCTDAIETLVRLGYNNFNDHVINSAFATKNVLIIATLLVFHTNYDRQRLQERFGAKPRYASAMALVESEEFAGDLRRQAYFTDSLVTLVLREDRRLIQQRTSKTDKH